MVYVNISITICDSLCTGESKQSHLTKYDTIAPNLEINEIRFRNINTDVHGDSRCKHVIDRSSNVLGGGGRGGP